MKLHTNPTLFKQAITVTSQQIGLPEIYIEKDYWVTVALHTIYSNEIGKQAVFKGGTALSKCHQIIERFSEDIDLVVFKNENENGNDLKRKIKEISKIVGKVIPEIQKEGITNKMGMIRKTAHEYPKLFSGNFGQVRSEIIIEASWLGHFEPYHLKQINAYIYDMMIKTGQQKLAEQYVMLPFEVMVLDIKRTFCEKIMSLVRFSNGEMPIENLNNKIRHTYDLHLLLKNKDVITFFNSTKFDKMLLDVAQHDVVSFKNNNKFLKQHPKEALLFIQPEETWTKLKSTYNGSFKELVHGDFPDESEILKTVLLIASRLEKINWNLKF